MKNKTKKILKYLIFILLIVMLIVLVFVIFFINKNKTNDSQNIINENVIDIEDADEIEENEDNSVYNNFVSKYEDNNTTDVSNIVDTSSDIVVDSKLTPVINAKKYFLVKYCMERYYKEDNSEVSEENNSYTDEIINLIDIEARQALNINNENFSNIYGKLTAPMFCIDNMYEQKLTLNKSLYLVFYRIETDSGYANLAMFVKVDNKNKTFSVYPNEYLKRNNYLNLKQDDKVNINNIEDIEKTTINVYNEDEIDADDRACIKELYKKCKFDLLLDLEHLYNTLDVEYKNARFKTFDMFKQYVDSKKTELYLDKLLKYNSNIYDEKIVYTGISHNNNHYVFYVKNLTSYTLMLDNYTLVLPQYKQMYENNFTSVQARYCIERFMRAINDKNYEFAYSKLLQIQKNNYYPTINDFINFIQNNLYSENAYEYGENFSVSDNVYQYSLKVTDANNSNSEAKTLNIAVTLLDENANFNIAVVVE